MNENNNSSRNKNNIPIKIAVCPTFYKAFLSTNNLFSPIKTQSTAESLKLLAQKKVDHVLAGRTLKPNEKKYPFKILGQGYSFISSQERIINEKELKVAAVFTDISKPELTQIFGLTNVQKVNNIYDYLDKGIVITSWNNTDYAKAKIIHLVDDYGNRNVNSRIPIVYCLDSCNDDIVNKLKTVFYSI